MRKECTATFGKLGDTTNGTPRATPAKGTPRQSKKGKGVMDGEEGTPSKAGRKRKVTEEDGESRPVKKGCVKAEVEDVAVCAEEEEYF